MMIDQDLARELAMKLWRLLPEVSDKDAIYQSVEFLQEIYKS
jgi:hypothetical protein